MKPLAVDLCCGLGGWSEGLLAEGWDVIGFDIERHVYGGHRYPAQLVLQNILTLTGHQFRGKVSLIIASPPCQKYSYMAMPWTRAKVLHTWYRDARHPERIAELNALFDACVRIGREAQCPTIIENVRGAQPWVGRARWNYGSFYLWGDVPALMPPTFKASKVPGFRFDGNGGSFQSASVRESSGIKTPDCGAPGWFGNYQQMCEGVKQRGSGREWFAGDGRISRMTSSSSPARKMASAMIAKIPEPLSRYIAVTFKPRSTT